MDRSRSANPDKLKKVIKTLHNMPDMKVPQAMLSARFYDEEVADLSLRWFIQQSLPGKMLKGLKAHVLGPLPPPPPQPDRGEQLCNCAIDDKAVRIEEGSHAAGIGTCEQVILATLSPLPPLPLALARPQGWPPSLVSTSTAAVKKRKSWDRAYYLKKKLHVLKVELAAAAAVIAPASIAVAAPAAIAAAAADPAAAAASSAAAAVSASAAAADPWSVDTNLKVHMPAAQKMMKHRCVKPVVDNILRAGSMQAQAAVLRAVAGHPSLAHARELASIESSKMQAACKFVCEQSSRLMKTNCNWAFLQAKTTDKKRDAVKVMLTFSAPLPEKMTLVPSQRDCAPVLGVPQSTLATREKALIKKRWQLSAGKKGIFWALAKRKKWYSKINDVIRLLLVTAFNNHPHVIVSPNSRDTLQVKNADGKKAAVPKLLMQVGLRTIFSDIIKDNPTIKNKVGECAFRYIISGLGSIRCFTNSYKQMCGCTECVGLHTLHCLLLAKRGVTNLQFAVDVQHCTRATQATKKTSGWAAVAWHPKPSLAIMEGICQRWSSHTLLHWKCQTLQCSDCKEYPVPKEEAQEDGAVEDISFHVYEYKVSLHKDGKERRRLELVQKCTRIVKFHRLYYWPALGRGRYHSTSYMLAARCWRERWAITHGSISSHCNYGERMPLSFNKEIQSGYYQNMSVSVEGASIEWVDAAGEMRTC